jgi:hypothetical protein
LVRDPFPVWRKLSEAFVEVRLDNHLGLSLSLERPSPAALYAFASPKSNTFTVPSGRTLMFAGFRSR